MQIHLHPALQRFNHGAKLINIEPCSVNKMLDSIVQAQPELKSVLFDTEGDKQPFVHIYINNQSMDTVDGTTQLKADDRIEIISALVGG